jgi:transcriptional regulator with XRE-family HTH domain
LPTRQIVIGFSLPGVKNLADIFGLVLKTYRQEKGMTQQQLADFTGLDRAFISELENGKLIPSLETFFRLCRQLKVPPEEFIKQIDQKLSK